MKFVGKISTFSCSRNHNTVHTLALAPKSWYVDHKFMYTFVWEPNFDVSSNAYSPMLVWVETSYRVLILENKWIEIAELLGEVLVYLNEDNHSLFSNDRVCVLWDMYQETPLSIALNYKGILIWQLIHFKNMPFTCYIHKVFGHMARECN